MRTLYVSLLTVTLAISCLAFSQKPASGPVEFETVMIGQHSLIDTAAVFLIDNAEKWNDFWKLAQGEIEPLPPAPEIDFDKHNLIAAFMGQQNSSGYSVEIARIIRDGEDLQISIINHISKGGMLLPVITNPCHIVKLPGGDYTLKVEYTEQKQ